MYKRLFESNYILIGYYDGKDFNIAKTKDSFKSIKNILLKNEMKGVFQIPIEIFTDQLNVIQKIMHNLPRKSLENLYHIKKNYRSIDEIKEI